MDQSTLKSFIKDLEAELHGLQVASNDATNDFDPETSELVDHAVLSLDAAVKHLRRFARRRSKF